MVEVGRGQIRQGPGSGEDITIILGTLERPVEVIFGQRVTRFDFHFE